MRSGICGALAIGIVFTGVWAWAGPPTESYELAIQDGKLWQGKYERVFRAVEIPTLLAPETKTAEVLKAFARLSEPGANAVCFNLPGLNAGGTALSDATLKTIETFMAAADWRRIGAICRVLPPGAPKDASFRKAAVQTVAKALKTERRILYWIDGPDAAELIEQFRQAAPLLLTLGAAGGHLRAVTDPAQASGPLDLVVGRLPNAAQVATVSCMLPAADASYAALDEALKNPAESKPWKPDNSVLSEQEKAEGFISLFDGRTLDGWWVTGDKKDGFIVKDGAIVWNGAGAKALYTRDRYDNFVLRADWKLDKDGNSGIYVRAPRTNRQSKIGMEIQIMGDTGTPVTEQTTGAIYDVVPPRMNASKPEGQWNSYEITCDGPKVKIVLNGQVVQDTNLDDYDELRYRLRRGFIGLQDHTQAMSFKNIRIKKL